MWQRRQSSTIVMILRACCVTCVLVIAAGSSASLLAGPPLITDDSDTPGRVTGESCNHTFDFISPADTIKYGDPNSCNGCHADKTS